MDNTTYAGDNSPFFLSLTICFTAFIQFWFWNGVAQRVTHRMAERQPKYFLEVILGLQVTLTALTMVPFIIDGVRDKLGKSPCDPYGCFSGYIFLDILLNAFLQVIYLTGHLLWAWVLSFNGAAVLFIVRDGCVCIYNSCCPWFKKIEVQEFVI